MSKLTLKATGWKRNQWVKVRILVIFYDGKIRDETYIGSALGAVKRHNKLQNYVGTLFKEMHFSSVY